MSQLLWHTIHDFHDAPSTCGVYEYWQKGQLLYIGKAVNLKARLSSHAQNARLDAKEAAIVAGETIKYTLCDSEFIALMLEAELIRSHMPPHNRVWKDDKTYLYIVIDLVDPFPRPHFGRAHDLRQNPRFIKKDKKFRVFGPFPNSYIAEEVLRGIRRLVPFCMAKNIGKHACFYSRIGLCHPCPTNILKLAPKESDLQKKQYQTQLKQVIKILDGQDSSVIKDLNRQMQQYARKLDFENALKIRQNIARFTHFVTSQQFHDMPLAYDQSPARLQALQHTLSPYHHQTCAIQRIECYDASHSALHDSVVSMTVMTDGRLDRGQYRRFKIKNPQARSDFDRLDEAISRRLKNKTWPKPDLIVIDGGIPQLRRLQPIFDKQADPPFFLGLAKHPDRLILPGDSRKVSNYITVKLPSDDPCLLLLGQIRDEAHRFANSYRKILESKRTKL